MIIKLDKNRIERYIAEGLIIRQWHPTLPLQILNYSRACEYQQAWDDYTLNLRGAIYDKDFKLISGNMSKFFNFYQHTTETQKEIEERMLKEKFMTQDKWDGCIGNVFEYNGEIVCASKGSFDSFVTKEMYKMIKGKLFVNDLEDCSSNLIVEVIHPNTHILCNYGDTKEFRVITSFRCDKENNDYFEWSYEDTLNIIHNMDPKQELLKPIESHNLSFEQLREWQKQHNDKLTEGFVVRFLDDNFRVKFKSEEYLSIAAVKSNADPIHIYKRALEVAKVSKSINNWYENMKLGDTEMPDELYSEYTRIIDKIKDILETKYREVCKIYCVYKDVSNKEIGLNQNFTSNVKSLLFSLRKQEPIIEKLLKMSEGECLNV